MSFDLVARTIAMRPHRPAESQGPAFRRPHPDLSDETQALCFFAGANSIFYGDKLLTAANPQTEQDLALLAKLGMTTQKPNRDMEAPAAEPERELAPAVS